MSTRSHPINGLVMVASPDDLRALGDYCHIAASEIAAEIQAAQEHHHD